MNIETFTGQFTDAIELPAGEVTPQTKFKDLEIWDSLCVLNVIAMVDSLYNVAVSGNDLEKGNTVVDIFNLVQARVK
jgi:acyl carrier protein